MRWPQGFLGPTHRLNPCSWPPLTSGLGHQTSVGKGSVPGVGDFVAQMSRDLPPRCHLSVPRTWPCRAPSPRAQPRPAGTPLDTRTAPGSAAALPGGLWVTFQSWRVESRRRADPGRPQNVPRVVARGRCRRVCFKLPFSSSSARGPGAALGIARPGPDLLPALTEAWRKEMKAGSETRT